MRKQSGISLIEQLVTLVITSFAVLGVAKFQVNMFDAELNSKQRAEAVSLAQQKLEAIRSTGYVAQAVAEQDEIQGMTTKFSRSWSVTPDTTSLYDKVSVTVTWSAKGSGSNVSLDSRVANVAQSNSGLFMLGQVGADTASGASPYNPTNLASAATASDTLPASPTGTPSGTTGNGSSQGTTGASNASCTNGQGTLPGMTCSPTPVSCSCSKSRHGQSYSYSIPSGQDALCTVAVCSATPNQCSPANNETCTFNTEAPQ